MRSFKIIFILLTACISVHGQADTTFREIRIMKGDYIGIAVDNLDNLYTLDSRNQLKKFNANGDSVAIYNDVKQFGTATLIDVTNPLKVLLYYHDFATVVELDRFLNPVNSMDLRKQNIFQARAVGRAYDNNVWVYDEAESKLKKVDEKGKMLLETPDFRLLLGKAITPIRIFDENRFVYIYDSIHGVYVFDYFGTLRNNIMIQNWQNFSVTGKFIYGSRNDTIFRYEISTFRVDEWKMPVTLVGSLAYRFSSSRIYALRREDDHSSVIYIYSIH